MRKHSFLTHAAVYALGEVLALVAGFLLLPAFVPAFDFLSFFRIMVVILQPLVALLGVPLRLPCG